MLSPKGVYSLEERLGCPFWGLDWLGCEDWALGYGEATWAGLLEARSAGRLSPRGVGSLLVGAAG